MTNHASIGEAMALHKAGHLDEAATAYRGLLAIRPEDPRLLHLLGVVCLQRGDPGAAVTLIGDALAKGGQHPARLNDLGSALRGAGRPGEAAAAYQAAIAARSEFPEAFFGLAAALHEAGQLAAAIKALRDGLVLQPANSRARFRLGSLLSEAGNFESAGIEFRSLQAAMPDNDDIAAGLAAALFGAGDLAGGETAFRRSLEARPDDPERLCGLGRLLLAADRPTEAEPVLRKALAIQPDHGSARFNLGRALVASGRMDRQFLRDWLGLGGAVPSILRAALIDHLKLPSAIGSLIAGDGPLPPGALSTLAGEPLLRDLLYRDVVDDLEVENLLTRMRQSLWSAETSDTDVLVLLCALAWQCFLNEYVFFETTSEAASVETLAAGLASDPGPDPWRLALYACYRPLHALGRDDVLVNADLPPAVAGLIRQQVLEPGEERRIAKDLPSCTLIEDDVSRLVREQYEHNPYPRWQAFSRLDAAPMERVLIGLFPYLAERSIAWADEPRVLVAGCGTGHHSAATAQRFSGCHVTAVDLSRASLSYGARKTRAAGLTNLEYRQGDILGLGVLDERFDLIESAGVLHHMADPLVGWRVLRELLKPGGFMKIGLYSELGRASIVAARQLIAEQGLADDEHGIRAGRQAIAGLADEHPAHQVVRRPDFFSMSTCRDMIFHVQEHRLSIPAIGAMLEVLDLEFLGFEFSSRALRRRYRKRNPHDTTLTDLAGWERFEADHPGTFAGMYLFWARDRSDA